MNTSVMQKKLKEIRDEIPSSDLDGTMTRIRKLRIEVTVRSSPVAGEAPFAVRLLLPDVPSNERGGRNWSTAMRRAIDDLLQTLAGGEW